MNNQNFYSGNGRPIQIKRNNNSEFIIFPTNSNNSHHQNNLESLNDSNSIDFILKKINIVSKGHNFSEAKILLFSSLIICISFLLRESSHLYESLGKNSDSKGIILKEYQRLGGEVKDFAHYSNSAQNSGILRRRVLNDYFLAKQRDRGQGVREKSKFSNLKLIGNDINSELNEEKLSKFKTDLNKLFDNQRSNMKEILTKAYEQEKQLVNSIFRNKILFCLAILLFPLVFKAVTVYLKKNLYIQLRKFLDLENQGCKQMGVQFKINKDLNEVTIVDKKQDALQVKRELRNDEEEPEMYELVNGDEGEEEAEEEIADCEVNNMPSIEILEQPANAEVMRKVSVNSSVKGNITSINMPSNNNIQPTLQVTAPEQPIRQQKPTFCPQQQPQQQQQIPPLRKRSSNSNTNTEDPHPPFYYNNMQNGTNMQNNQFRLHPQRMHPVNMIHATNAYNANNNQYQMMQNGPNMFMYQQQQQQMQQMNQYYYQQQQQKYAYNNSKEIMGKMKRRKPQKNKKNSEESEESSSDSDEDYSEEEDDDVDSLQSVSSEESIMTSPFKSKSAQGFNKKKTNYTRMSQGEPGK